MADNGTSKIYKYYQSSTAIILSGVIEGSMWNDWYIIEKHVNII